MLKMIQIFSVLLPLMVVIVAWFFGAANLKGFVIVGVAWFLGLCWGFYQASSTNAMFLLFLAGALSVVAVPTLGAVVSVLLPPPPGKIPAEEVREAYNNLSPEQQESLKRGLKIALRSYAAHLRTRGRVHLADCITGIVG